MSDKTERRESWLVPFLWRLSWFFSVTSAMCLGTFIAVCTYTNIPQTLCDPKFGCEVVNTRGWGGMAGLYFGMFVLFGILAAGGFVGWYELHRDQAKKAARYAEDEINAIAKGVLSDEEYAQFEQRAREARRMRPRGYGDLYS